MTTLSPKPNSVAATLTALFLSLFPASAEVVINEIHYNGEPNTAVNEFVELHNTGPSSVDISGWFFSDGIDFTFPPGTAIPSGGFVVVAQRPSSILSQFGVTALGPYLGELSGSGERVQLRNASNQVIDEVTYNETFPWPVGAGGSGSSMELINPALDNDLGGAWRSSSIPMAGGPPPDPLVPVESTWRYFKGTSEPSSPTAAWREVGFDDSGWITGQSPFFYENSSGYTGNTDLTDMSGNYSSIYLRKTFTVDDPSRYIGLVVNSQSDDGCIIWLNGTEVARVNVAAGEVPFNGTTPSSGEPNASTDTIPGGVLTAGENVLAIHALNASLAGSSDFMIEAELKIPEAGEAIGRPTPGGTNSVYALNAPPLIRQVDHSPNQPVENQPTIISAKVTDVDGVASVTLEYQIVAPGAYIPAYLAKPFSTLTSSPTSPNDPNPAYAVGWASVIMKDDGTGGDLTADDGTYTVTLAGRPNRTLVRYRIIVEDSPGNTVRVPYADDDSLNFAYFVYNGVPDYVANTRSVLGVPHTYPSELLTSLPVYHLITTAADFDYCVAYSGNQIPGGNFDARKAYNWAGTFVYDGKVYDNIGYRLRQRNARYSGSGKRSFKFRFNRGYSAQFRDNDGNPYPTKWSRLATHKMVGSRGNSTWGLLQAANGLLWNNYDVPGSFTHHLHLRVIRGAEEAPSGANGQYLGDFYGMLLALEEYDVDFLDAHNLPKGNVYKLITSRTDGVSVRRYLEKDSVDDGSDFQNIIFNLNKSQPDQWLRDHVNYDEWNRYHAIVDAVRHYDVDSGGVPNTGEHLKNRAYYFDTSTSSPYGRLWVMPWDSDTSWGPNWNAGVDFCKYAIINPDRTEFTREYSNVMREVRDLIWTEEQVDLLLDHLVDRIKDFVPADRDRWTSGVGGSQSDPPIENVVGDMKKFAFVGGSWIGGDQPIEAISRDSGISGQQGRDAYLDAWTADTQIPSTPIITVTGPGNFPVNRLSFRVANYSGSNPFAAWNWRIAEITPTNQLGSLTQTPKFEIQDVWMSGEINNVNVTDITIPQSAVRVGRIYRVRARAKDTTGRWSHWSSPIEFTSDEPDSASILLANLRISELMFNSPGGSEFDFVELHNTSVEATLDLAGAKFTQGIDFTFPAGTVLPPDGYIVVVNNTNANFQEFRDYYGIGSEVTLTGPYDQNFSNGGEMVVLRTSVGGTDIVAFEYHDGRGWPLAADGTGHSMIPLTNEGQASGTLNYGGNWRASTYLGGSPGTADPALAPTLLINEVAAHTDAAGEFESNDWIELYNASSEEITLGAGWYLSDDNDPTNLTKWMIPAGTIIPAGSFVSFDENTGFHNPTNTGFGLSKAGEAVLLSYLPGSGGDRVIDSVRFKGQANGSSLGRFPDGGPHWYGLTPPTRDSANTAPTLHPIITELMYHPPDIDAMDNSLDEYIELFNPGTAPIDLFNTNGSWRLDGIGFNLPPNTSLPPMGYLLVVNFDPLDTAQLGLFRTKYAIDPSIPVVGPYNGKLGNASERVALEEPQAPDLPDDSLSWIIVDEVIYADQNPWQVAADGLGSSLHRQDPLISGNEPTNWRAAAPTAGSAYGGGTPPTITLQPSPPLQTSPAGANISYTIEATGTEPLTYLWLFNGNPLNAAEPSLSLINVQPPNSGTYSVVVLNPAGSAQSDPVVLNVTTPPAISAHPLPLTVFPDANVLFTVNATGSGVLFYQWRKDGLDIPGANSASYSINNVQAEDDATYTVVVADVNGAVISNPARLTVLIRPSVIVQPVPQSVIAGGSVTFSVQTAGTLPMGYRWRRGGATVANLVLDSHVSFLTLNGVTAEDAGSYTVILTNEAFYAPGVLSARAALTVLTDTDGDGIDDTWESEHHLDPNDPTDANGNLDGDLLSNKEEYVAGTDPEDPLSFLQIESLIQDIEGGGPNLIRFLAASNKTYSVEFIDSLPPDLWSKLVDVPATVTNRVVEIEDLVPPVGSARYYRLVTPRQQ